MKLNFIKKQCPSCKSQVPITLFSNKNNINPCPNCGKLLIEDPKRNLIGSFVNIFGVVLGIIFPLFVGIRPYWGFLFVAIALFISIMISKRIVIKKDLIIRNKENNQVSYINDSDWKEITNNLIGKENTFEIIEELN